MKQIGRPTDNPKMSPVQVRLDEDTNAILVEYCEKNHVSRSEAIRYAIRRILAEDKK